MIFVALDLLIGGFANMSIVLKLPNGYPQVVKRNKIRLHGEDFICWAFWFQSLFNGNGGNLEKYDMD